jgi:hypothetical protein
MKIFIRLYALGLLIYTGWRTYDFMYTQLPQNDFTFVLAIAFLLATELGLILWHETHLSHVTTAAQDTLTAWMTWIDFGGSVLAGIADMIIRQTMIDGYQLPREFAIVLMVGLPVIMGLNVAAVILFEQWDAKTQENKARKAYLFEAHREAMGDIEADREGFAREYRTRIKDTIRQEAGISLDKRHSAPRLNGKVAEPITYNQEAQDALAPQAHGGNADHVTTPIVADNGKKVNPTRPRQTRG